MGRNRKTGLDYFPLDVNFFQDIKVRRLLKKHGSESIAVYTSLLCMIYRDGYFIEWNEDIPFIVSEQTGLPEEDINRVICSCLELDIFSKQMMEESGVLTSKGIQKRYQDICTDLKRRADIDAYSLISSEGIRKNEEKKVISSEEMPIYSEETGINPEEMTENDATSGISSGKSATIKEKEKKGNKKKEKEIKENSSFSSRGEDVPSIAVTKEEEKDFFEIFFFKNFSDPWKQTERFIAHNSARGWTGDRGAVFDSPRKRLSLARLWEQKDSPPGSKRFPDWFIDVWKRAYAIAKDGELRNAEVADEMLSRTVSAETGINLKDRRINCGKSFGMWYKEHEDILSPIFRGIQIYVKK